MSRRRCRRVISHAFGGGPGGAAGETPLEADQAENAKPEIVVQRQQGGELLAFARFAKPHAMVA